VEREAVAGPPPSAQIRATSGKIWARSGHLHQARSWPPPARSGPDPARFGLDRATSVAGLQSCHLHRRMPPSSGHLVAE
jgi:hypothetical protein